MKKFFKKLKNKIGIALWKVRNFYYRIKRWIGSQFKKFWNLITFKQKRDQKRVIKETKLKEILGIDDPEVNIYHDIDIESIRISYEEKLAEVNLQLKESKNSQLIEEKASLVAILKLFPPTKKQVLRREEVKKTFSGWGKAALYLTPVLILLALFSFYPIVNAFRLSFLLNYKEASRTHEGFTLYGNFLSVLKDDSFIVPAGHTGSSAMINTLVIVIFTVPVSIAITLLIAVLLNSIKPLQNLFQTIFFLPYVTNSLAVGLVFAYMFRTDGGLINTMLKSFGVDGGAWVSNGATYAKSMFVLVLFEVWNGLAFKILVFMSAIQGIDKQYYQAAQIDATPRFKQFRRITVPLISPTILYVVITSVIGSFKTYSSVIAIFGNTGQPAGVNFNLKTIVFYIYDLMESNISRAAAASVILFILILGLTLIQMQISKKRVHY